MIEFTLPRPFSANKIHSTVRNRRVKSRAYRLWIEECSLDLLRQRVKPFQTPILVDIDLPKGSRLDTDNATKPILDLLVRCGLIPDDRASYVRGTSAAHSEEPLTTIRVTESVSC